MTSRPRSVLSMLGWVLLFVSAPQASALQGFDPHGSGPAYPQEANGRQNGRPSIQAHRVTGAPIKVDGRLDESDWVAASAASGFSQFEPDRLGDPCEEAVFKVLYDDKGIYFGVSCPRLNGAPVVSRLSRRDQITASDQIRIFVDPYHDLTTGYCFRVNPHGVKEDYYCYNDMYMDSSWNAVWEADTFVDDRGWTAEIRIPFSSIRYKAAESMTWGLNVFEYIHSRGERTVWSNWDRDQHGFMSRSGTIVGIEDIPPPRQLEITPYLMSRTTDPADPTAHRLDGENWDSFANIGADLKYGVTADLTLNATIQPDFGQVEADPSLLNLSPFETLYEEKRPFFIEGAQFFYHPDFIVTHTRRIGSGTENSRIRFAGKLTGKVAGDVATAVMVAMTDETEEGKAHNLFRSGARKTVFAVARFGKQFHNDMHSINVMQNAVIRDESSFEAPSRDGYVTGADFKLNFRDRMYNINGSFVGSVVDPHPDGDSIRVDPAPIYGTGGRFELMKASGDWQGALTTRLQHDKLDINDFGYINNPNHYAVQAWVTRVYNADDESRWISSGSAHARWYKSWLYAGRRVLSQDDPDEILWSYDRGHRNFQTVDLEGSLTTRDYWGLWMGVEYALEGTDYYATRMTPDGSTRGPLMTSPANYNMWVGCNTDSRRDLSGEVNLSWDRDEEGSKGFSAGGGIHWVQSSRMNHRLSFGFSDGHDDAQWIGNADNPSGGIGGVSYLFSKLDQRTWDLTLRSSLLFNRDQSLELYLQPFLTVGDFSNTRELASPDSYDLRPYAAYQASSDDFSYGSVNLNMVYRWEYRPGSTLYVVWTHARDDYRFRGGSDAPDEFENDFGTDPLFKNEAENKFLVKISYWFSV